MVDDSTGTLYRIWRLPRQENDIPIHYGTSIHVGSTAKNDAIDRIFNGTAEPTCWVQKVKNENLTLDDILYEVVMTGPHADLVKECQELRKKHGLNRKFRGTSMSKDESFIPEGMAIGYRIYIPGDEKIIHHGYTTRLANKKKIRVYSMAQMKTPRLTMKYAFDAIACGYKPEDLQVEILIKDELQKVIEFIENLKAEQKQNNESRPRPTKPVFEAPQMNKKKRLDFIDLDGLFKLYVAENLKSLSSESFEKLFDFYIFLKDKSDFKSATFEYLGNVYSNISGDDFKLLFDFGSFIQSGT